MQATGEAAKGRVDPGPANKDGPSSDTKPVHAQQAVDPAVAAGLAPTPSLTLVPNARLQTLSQTAPAAQPVVNPGTLAKLGRVTGVALAADFFFSTNHPTAEHTYLGANARVEHGLATAPQLQTFRDGTWMPADVAFEMREGGIAVDLAALEAATGLTAPEVLGPGIESLPIMDDPGPTHTGHPPVELEDDGINSTPIDDGLDLPNDTGGAPPVLETGPLVTPIPEEVGPDVVTMGEANGDFQTPDGNTIRNHGSGGTGEEYMLGYGHTAELVDEIIREPAFSYPSAHGDTSTGGRDDATVVIGQSGDWVVVNDRTGDIIQLNDRFNPRQELPE